jgi:7-keto-8-aminopelargonate synthetase-like enzyme
MHADRPRLAEMIALARKFGAVLILDIAHDFGAMGQHGLGLLETIGSEDAPDVIMGSFSKTFASNGGFVAASQSVKEYLGIFSAPWVFSNALSPIQAGIVLECLDIVFSDTGAELRQHLAANVLALRNQMCRSGFDLGGEPSPIVPIVVGDDRLAGLMFREINAAGLAANLVGFPGVAPGSARFRFQLMSCHTASDIESATRIMTSARDIAVRRMSETCA